MVKFFEKFKDIMFVSDDEDSTEQLDKIDDELQEVITQQQQEVVKETIEEPVPTQDKSGFITLEKEETIQEEVVEQVIEEKPSFQVSATEYVPTKIISPIYGVIDSNNSVNDYNRPIERNIEYSTESIVSPVYGRGIKTETEQKESGNVSIESQQTETIDNYSDKPNEQPITEIIPDKFASASKEKENDADYENLSIFDF